MKRSVLAGLLCLAAMACASGPPPVALENKTFYQYDDARPIGAARPQLEQPYPTLDRGSGYVGVTVLGGTVRMSRPVGWRIRRASLAAGKRFIEYVSPHGYLVALYEREDSPSDAWRDVLARYEDDAKAKGVGFLGRSIPFATRSTQGREYVVRRVIKTQSAAYVNTTREVLLRGAHRVDLFEVAWEGEMLSELAKELLPVVDTIEVL